MLIQLWETDPLMVGIASALGVPLILCLMFFWSRYVEYLTLRRMLRNGTAQVLRRLVLQYKGSLYTQSHNRALKGLVFAVYELGGYEESEICLREGSHCRGALPRTLHYQTNERMSAR